MLLEQEGKVEEAMKLLRKSAEEGKMFAQYNLGLRFEAQGKDALAKAWFRKAADQGHLDARQKLRVFGIF